MFAIIFLLLKDFQKFGKCYAQLHVHTNLTSLSADKVLGIFSYAVS